MDKDIVVATKSGESAQSAGVQKPPCPLRAGRGVCPDRCNAGRFSGCVLHEARVTPGPLFPPSRRP